MHPLRTLPPLLLGVALAAACSAPDERTEAMVGGTESVQPQLHCYVADGTEEEAANRPSPLRQARFAFPGGEALLCYGSPSARGRVVMGELVPFGQPWRSGANEATALHLSAPASLGGVELAPGSYSIYTVPGEDRWEVSLSTSFERWGIPIDQAVEQGVVGSFVAPSVGFESPVESLTWSFEPSEDGGSEDVVLRWERTEVRMPFRPAPR